MGRIHVPQFEAHVIGHRQRSQSRCIAGTEIAVDVALAEAGVLDGSLGRRGMQLGGRLVLGLACRVLINPDDIGLVLDAHRGLVLPRTAKAWSENGLPFGERGQSRIPAAAKTPAGSSAPARCAPRRRERRGCSPPRCARPASLLPGGRRAPRTARHPPWRWYSPPTRDSSTPPASRPS